MSELFSNVNGRLVPRDVCARKHGGNEQSNAAFQSVQLNSSQRKVFAMLCEYGNFGQTVDGLSIALGTTPNAISGRLTELRIMGKIEKRGTRKTRSGCSASVWVAK